MRACVVLTARPSWAKLEPVCRALRGRGVDLPIVVCASALLERYGNVCATVEREYSVAEKVYSVYEGATLETGAIEAGALQSALARTYARLKPDVVVVCADRHEVLAAAAAARMLEIRLLHMQGGELSGSVDNDIRDAITQLADIHCVATERAKWRVYGLTGSDQIHNTGCPSLDLAKQALSDPPVTAEELGGAGAAIDGARQFVIVLQHPVTDEMAQAGKQMAATLAALDDLPQQVVCYWPGEDAGADAMSKVIRTHPGLHTVRSLPPARFLRLLTQCACLVGNSSAGIREASYMGVPVVNIGSRQHGRERGPNVVDVGYDSTQIGQAIQRQIAHGRYPSSSLYGRGDAGERIADVICG